MQRKWHVATVVLVVLIPRLLCAAGMVDAVGAGLRSLDLKKGDPALCVLSNAVYVDHAALDMLEDRTGCSLGKGNLLFYHCPSGRPLKAALFRRDTRVACLLTQAGEGMIERVQLAIGPEQTSNPETWKEIGAKLGADTAMVGILNAWADGAPNDLLKCVEFHNHFCPGVTSGYLMAKYIQAHWPLTGRQAYLYIAAPVWCKEDAIQQLLDLTAGKHGIVTKPLAKDQLKDLPYTQPAGILIVREERNGPGTAHVLCFDWELANRGIKDMGGMKKNPLSWNDAPEKYISSPLSLGLTAEEIARLELVENPYQFLVSMEKKEQKK